MRVALVLFLVLAGLATLLFWPRAETRMVAEPPGEAVVEASGKPAALAEPVDAGAQSEEAQPVAERREALAAPASKEAPSYRVVVRDESGGPIEGATVLLYAKDWRGKEAWDLPPKQEAQTSSDGVATYEGETSEFDELLVFATNRLPACVERSSQTEDVVTLHGGWPLAGRVTVDGRIPDEEILLDVRGFRDESAAWSAPARRLIADLGIGRSRASCAVDSNGNFELLGLRAEESVSFVVPDDYRFLNPTDPDSPQWSETFPVSRGVLLELTRLASIVGRPVLVAEPQATGEPSTLPSSAREITIVYTIENEAGETIRDSSQYCPTGERFSVPMPPDAMRAELLFKTDWFGGEVLAQRTVEGPFVGEHDLGDIPVNEPGQKLVLQVVDAGGSAIEGARALLSGRLSEPTDEAGKTELERRNEDERLIVGARGFELRTIELPHDPPQPFLITLGTPNSIRLELLPAVDGLPTEGLRVYLGLPGGMTEDMPEMHGSFAAVNGAVPGGGMWSTDERTHVYELEPTGIFERFNLPPDTEISLAVLDRYENEVFEEKLTLGPHEQRNIVRRLPVEPRTFQGRVIDEEGEPVRTARIESAGFFGDSPNIGEDGGFRMDNIYTEDPQFWIRADGFVPLELNSWDELSRSPFVLAKGRTVWVEVTGPMESGDRVSVKLTMESGRVFAGRRVRDGLYEFSAVPFGSALVTAEFDGQKGEAPLAPASDRVSIHL